MLESKPMSTRSLHPFCCFKSVVFATPHRCSPPEALRSAPRPILAHAAKRLLHLRHAGPSTKLCGLHACPSKELYILHNGQYWQMLQETNYYTCACWPINKTLRSACLPIKGTLLYILHHFQYWRMLQETNYYTCACWPINKTLSFGCLPIKRTLYILHHG